MRPVLISFVPNLNTHINLFLIVSPRTILRTQKLAILQVRKFAWFCYIFDFKLLIWYNHFFLRLETDFFSVLCYHEMYLQQIHWNENLCRMYGLAMIASVATVNICQILRRYCSDSCETTHIKVLNTEDATALEDDWNYWTYITRSTEILQFLDCIW